VQHSVPQHVSPLVHVRPPPVHGGVEQWPLPQYWSPLQPCPQLPQLFGSLFGFTHWWLQHFSNWLHAGTQSPPPLLLPLDPPLLLLPAPLLPPELPPLLLLPAPELDPAPLLLPAPELPPDELPPAPSFPPLLLPLCPSTDASSPPPPSW